MRGNHDAGIMMTVRPAPARTIRAASARRVAGHPGDLPVSAHSRAVRVTRTMHDMNIRMRWVAVWALAVLGPILMVLLIGAVVGVLWPSLF